MVDRLLTKGNCMPALRLMCLAIPMLVFAGGGVMAADSSDAIAEHIEAVKQAAMNLQIETPSWGYGNSGTRFKVFQEKGIPRDTFEKFEDAAAVHKLTGIAPSVAIHIWARSSPTKSVPAMAVVVLPQPLGAAPANQVMRPPGPFMPVMNMCSESSLPLP